MLVKSGGAEGTLDKTYAEMVTRALCGFGRVVGKGHHGPPAGHQVAGYFARVDRAGLIKRLKIRDIPYT